MNRRPSFILRAVCTRHDSINSFRKRFLAQLEDLFVQILLIAHHLGVLKLGDIFIDGSKVEANASKHKAISWGYANKLEAHLKAEVEKLLELPRLPMATNTEG
jgi:hypothetical protein